MRGDLTDSLRIVLVGMSVACAILFLFLLQLSISVWNYRNKVREKHVRALFEAVMFIKADKAKKAAAAENQYPEQELHLGDGLCIGQCTGQCAGYSKGISWERLQRVSEN